jgi:hypothetical protein
LRSSSTEISTRLANFEPIHEQCEYKSKENWKCIWSWKCCFQNLITNMYITLFLQIRLSVDCSLLVKGFCWIRSLHYGTYRSFLTFLQCLLSVNPTNLRLSIQRELDSGDHIIGRPDGVAVPVDFDWDRRAPLQKERTDWSNVWGNYVYVIFESVSDLLHEPL